MENNARRFTDYELEQATKEAMKEGYKKGVEDTGNAWIRFGIVIVVFIVMIAIIGGMYGCPKYQVWQQGLKGQAELARAEQNRKIAVQEAMAKQDAAKNLAQAEIERAKGVAEANRIIGEGLKGHEEYLRYLWIMGLEHTANVGDKVVYIPTEANLPILEAARFKMPEIRIETPKER